MKRPDRAEEALLRRALRPGKDRTALSVAGIAAAGLLLATSAALLCARWIVLPARDARGQVMALRKESSLLRDGLGPAAFTERDIAFLRAQEGLLELCPVRRASFQVYGEVAFGGGGYGSLLFVESVPDDWLDKPFPGGWKEGDPVPALVGESFLFIYNSAFAPAYGLPEIKGAYLGFLPVSLELRGRLGSLRREARVLGSTALMDSILVPDAVLESWNRELSGEEPADPVKLLLRVEPGRAAAIAAACREKGFSMERNSSLGTALASFIGGAGIALALMALFAAVQASSQFLMGLELELRDSQEALDTLLLWGHPESRLAALRRARVNRMLALSLAVSLALIGALALLSAQALRPWLPLPLAAAVASLLLIHGLASLALRMKLSEA